MDPLRAVLGRDQSRRGGAVETSALQPTSPNLADVLTRRANRITRFRSNPQHGIRGEDGGTASIHDIGAGPGSRSCAGRRRAAGDPRRATARRRRVGGRLCEPDTHPSGHGPRADERSVSLNDDSVTVVLAGNDLENDCDSTRRVVSTSPTPGRRRPHRRTPCSHPSCRWLARLRCACN